MVAAVQLKSCRDVGRVCSRAAQSRWWWCVMKVVDFCLPAVLWGLCLKMRLSWLKMQDVVNTLSVCI
jgi:hypothetical protein